MRIIIKDLTFETIVGILEKERHTPQKVILHVKIDYAYAGENFIDYANVCTFFEPKCNKSAIFYWKMLLMI